ncbi:MAG: hypothetical protein BEN19_07005 [Epulopiscium sp. Nuni2H_MBin003]|nr:MAG: hypothetical protein BEN19_07005 [Epulopiscium sp. Nuni2H_MBin003]
MKQRSVLGLVICMLSGLTIGNFLGTIFAGIPVLEVLNYSQTFGLTTPVEVDFGFLIITLKIQFNITLVGILGLVIGVMAYRKI